MNKFLRIIFIFFFYFLSTSVRSQKTPMGISVKSMLDNLKDNETAELIVFSAGNSLSGRLSSAGIDFKTYFDNYYRIKIRKDQIELLEEMSEIEFIEPIRSGGFLLNDSMRSNNRITALHDGLPPFKQSYMGKGVVMGFIDTGIDFTHPDFQDTTGNTRVLKIWDQAADTLISSRIPGWGYGQVWDSSDINSGNCPHDDDVLSHGTNVAGIGAGNGLALNKLSGAAPESDIIVVASDFSSGSWLQTVADGVEFIFNQADMLKKSCVINISAGEYLGSHDGTDLAAIRIDSMIKSKKGRVLVAAAGNAGNLHFHLGYDVSSDTSFTWFQYNANSALGYGAVYYQLWADTGDFNQVEFAFGANLSAPSFQLRGQTSFDNIQNRLGVLYSDTIRNGSNDLGVVQTYAQLMGDKYLLEVNFPRPDSSQYLFSLITTGKGHLDIWSDSWLGLAHIYNGPFPTVNQLPEIQFYQTPDTLQTIVSSFTCLPSVITVANYVNRNSYVDYNNTVQTFNVTPGKRADNSSLGPNRLGQQKPDLIASGNYTLTPNRLASIPLHLANNQADRIASGGMHKRNGGTSMAAPVVAGIAALLLEECGNLDYQLIKDRLIQQVYTDTLTGTVPNYSYGYGKVDASSSIRTLYYKSLINPGGKIILCESEQIQLKGPAGMQSYSWSTGDSTADIIVDSSGIYILSTVDTNTCRSISDTAEVIKLGNPPKPTITKISETTLESSTANSYQWFKDNQFMPAETSKQLVISSGGDYSVEISDTNTCKSRSDSITMYLGILEGDGETRIKIYPNPSNNGIFFFECSNCKPNMEYDLEVFDTRGKLLSENKIKSGESFSISLKARGLYLYRFKNNAEVFKRGKLINNY